MKRVWSAIRGRKPIDGPCLLVNNNSSRLHYYSMRNQSSGNSCSGSVEISVLPWVLLAFSLHALLLAVLMLGKATPVEQPPVPIQVSLLDPSPVASPSGGQPDVPLPVKTVQQKPEVPATPRQVVPPKPVPKPAEKPVTTEKPVVAEKSVAEAPAEPVASTVTSAAASSSHTTSATSGAAAPAGNPGTSHQGGGGELTDARFDADYLQNPAPAYPPLSRRMGEEGKVLLRAYVLPNGRPETIEIKKGSGSSRLDESALAAVCKWRFVPARRGTEAVAAWVLIPISFRLES